MVFIKLLVNYNSIGSCQVEMTARIIKKRWQPMNTL